MADAPSGPWVLAGGPTICPHHPHATSGWRCERCARDLCADCVHRDPTPESRLSFCSHCGELARIRLLPRRSPRLLRQLRSALAPIATPGGALTVGILPACMSLLELPLRGGIVVRLANPAGWFTRALEMALFWSVFFEASKAGRRADQSLSHPALVESLGEAWKALVRGALALLPLLLLATQGRNDILQTISGDRRVAPLLETTQI